MRKTKHIKIKVDYKVEVDKSFSKMWRWIFFAWIVALISTLSALFIGEVMGQVPCVLCWYQRIFMFPLAVILGIAVYRVDTSIWRYGLPLAIAGWAVALFHSLLFMKIIPEPLKPCGREGPSCSGDDMTLFGFLPIPVLAVIAFTLIIIFLSLIFKGDKK